MGVESLKDVCVLCGDKVDSRARSFEQALVDDKDFCLVCWTEIMNEEYEPPVFYRSQGRVQVPWVS